MTLLIVRLSGRINSRAMVVLLATTAIALISTTLAISFLTARGAIYYDATKSLGIVGYLPLEEYLYFLLQVLLVGGVTLIIWRRLHRGDFE
ncbi:MAG: hypothetical protein KF726_22215 [Anaerolineae bacterium]|nr:hypothetical protein [Anaerolineae bacterium]